MLREKEFEITHISRSISSYSGLNILALPPFHVGLVMLVRPPTPPILDVGHLEQEAVAVVEPHRQDVLVVARSVPHAGDDHVLQGV